MAVGLKRLSQLSPVDGVQIGVCKAGIKYPDRYDLTVVSIDEGANVAGVFTKNQFCAAPVSVSKKHLSLNSPSASARYLVINTGNANAGTGEQGISDALKCCEEIARLTQTSPQSVLTFSTGVIGENLPMDRILAGLPTAIENCKADNWVSAAEAIMTTDTMPKGFSTTFECDGESVTISGIAKGSGMICPNMATLLSFIATDAKISQDVLQEMLEKANNYSFNSITIDSDTSTNDSCVLIATGKGKLVLDQYSDVFFEKLLALMKFLAQGLIRDGEGASKFIAVTVKNANDEAECRQIAYTVAHSPLVKTAFFASDANWGRILAAVGRAGVEGLDVNKINIHLNEVCIVEAGARSGNYTEEQGQAVMDKEDIEITIDIARGDIFHTIWTSDLSHDYIKINAEYRT